MGLDDKRQLYLDRAKEAEEDAAKSKDEDTRRTWLSIAEQYRQLAAMI
jgi:hypothetical protein